MSTNSNEKSHEVTIGYHGKEEYVSNLSYNKLGFKADLYDINGKKHLEYFVPTKEIDTIMSLIGRVSLTLNNTLGFDKLFLIIKFKESEQEQEQQHDKFVNTMLGENEENEEYQITMNGVKTTLIITDDGVGINNFKREIYYGPVTIKNEDLVSVQELFGELSLQAKVNDFMKDCIICFKISFENVGECLQGETLNFR